MGIVLILMIEIIAFVILIVPGIAIAILIIYLIKEKLINKSKILRILIYIVIMVTCAYISKTAMYYIISYESDKPDRLYLEMQEIHEEQILIGLTKEEVTNLLGEPKYTYKDAEEDFYVFDAGKIVRLLSSDIYELTVYFDENDKVERTKLKYIV